MTPSRHTLIAFGGKSPEHEVSVITAIQAMEALRETGLGVLPFYVSKDGDWYTGDALRSLDAYEDLPALVRTLKPCTFVRDPMLGVCLRTLTDGSWWSRLRGTGETLPLDAAIMAFHGGAGENGAFQGLFEAIGLPFTGGGVLASSLGMSKVMAKKVAQAAGVSVVPWVDATEQEWIGGGGGGATGGGGGAGGSARLLDAMEALGYPLIVKPVHLGSSIGIRSVRDREALRNAVEECFRYDAHVMVEKRIEPLLEVNCAVLGHGADAKASVCERPVGGDEILSFADKYMGGSGGAGGAKGTGGWKTGSGGSAGASTTSGGSKGMASASRIIPADIPDDLTHGIQSAALHLFREFEGAGVARFDFLVQGAAGPHGGDPSDASQHVFYFNEVNTIPGSFSFYLWDKSGVPFDRLLLDLLRIAKEDHRRRSGRVHGFDANLLKHRKRMGGLKGGSKGGNKGAGNGGSKGAGGAP